MNIKVKLLSIFVFAVSSTATLAALPGGCPTLKSDYLLVQNLIKDGNTKVDVFKVCIASGGDRLKCAENTFGYSANKHNELLSEWLAKQDQYFNIWNSGQGSCRIMGGGELPAKVQGVYAQP